MTRTKKIFVGGLSVNTTIEDVKHYFDQFGKVIDTQIHPTVMSSCLEDFFFVVRTKSTLFINRPLTSSTLSVLTIWIILKP